MGELRNSLTYHVGSKEVKHWDEAEALALKLKVKDIVAYEVDSAGNNVVLLMTILNGVMVKVRRTVTTEYNPPVEGKPAPMPGDDVSLDEVLGKGGS